MLSMFCLIAKFFVQFHGERDRRVEWEGNVGEERREGSRRV